MAKIDWEDLNRLASDNLFFEECWDTLVKLFETKDLSPDEFKLAYDTYLTFARTDNESNPGTDSYDMTVTWNSRIASRAYFDPTFSEDIWNYIGPGLMWASYEFRDEFFHDLETHPDTSSKLITHLLQMVKEHGDGLSLSNLDSLTHLKYFKKEMIDRLGIEIRDEE